MLRNTFTHHAPRRCPRQRLRSGRLQRRLHPVSQIVIGSPLLRQKMLRLVTACYALLRHLRSQEKPMFMRVLTAVTAVTPSNGPGGGKESPEGHRQLSEAIREMRFFWQRRIGSDGFRYH